MDGYVLVPSSELSAMRAIMDQLHTTVQTLALNQSNMPAQHKLDENGCRPLTDKEREYRISKTEVQNILGVSERTFYRRIKEYNILSIEDNGNPKFILGDLLDIISCHGLSWHPASLNRLLSKREIRYRPCYV